MADELEVGRALREPALVASDQAPSGLDPSGFDPARYVGKPRWFRGAERELLDSFWDALQERLDALSVADLRTFIRGCRKVSPINCGWTTYQIAKLLHDDALQALAEKQSAASCDTHPKGRDA